MIAPLVALVMAASAAGDAPAVSPRLHVHTGHQRDVSALAFSPDETLLATGAPDGTVRLWDVASGRETRVLLPRTPVERVAFSRDGSRLGALGGGYLLVWEVQHGSEATRISLPGVSAFDIAPDGRVVLATKAGIAAVVDASGKEALGVFGGGPPLVFTALLDGDRAVTVDAEGLARVWSLAAKNGVELARAPAPSAGEPKVAISGDRTVLGIATANGPLRLLRLPELTPIREGATAPRPLTAIALDGRGRRALLGTERRGADRSGEIEVLEVAGGAARRIAWESRAPSALALSASGDLLAVSARAPFANGRFAILSTGTGRPAVDVADPVEAPRSLRVSADGELLAVGSVYGWPFVWPLGGDGRPRSLGGETWPSAEGRVSVSADGKLVAATKNSAVVLHRTARTGRFSKHLEDDGADAEDVAIDADGGLLVTAREGTVAAVDTRAGRDLYRARVAEEPFTAMALHPVTRALAVARREGGVVLLDGRTGEERFRLGEDGRRIRSLAFDREGRRLLTGGEDGALAEWDFGTRGAREVASELGALLAVSWSPDGKAIAVANLRGQAAVLDAASGEVLQVMETGRAVVDLAFVDAPVPTLATVSADDPYVRLWDWHTGAPTARLVRFTDESWAVLAEDGRVDGTPPLERWIHAVAGNAPAAAGVGPALRATPGLLGEVLGRERVVAASEGPELVLQSGHAGAVVHVAFSPSGELLASTGDADNAAGDSDLRVWEVASRKQIWARSLRRGTGAVFSPDGARLAVFDGSRLELLDARSGERVAVVEAPVRSGRPVFLDASTVAFVALSEIQLHDAVTGVLRGRLQIDSSGWLAASSDGLRLAATAADGAIHVWRLPDGDRVILPSGPIAYTALAFRPGTHLLAAGNAAGLLEIWDVERRARVEHAHVDAYSIQGVDAISWAPEGTRLWAAARTGQVHELDSRLRATRALAVGLHGRYEAATRSVSSGGGLVAAGTALGSVEVWDAASGEPVDSFRQWAREVRTVATHPSRPLVAIGTEEGTKVLDLATGRLYAVSGGRGSHRVLGFTPDGAVITDEYRRGLVAHDPEGGSARGLLEARDVGVFAVSRAGDVAAVLDTGDPEQLVLDREGARRWAVPLDQGSPLHVEFSPGGDLVALLWRRADGDLEHVLDVFDAATGRRLRRLDVDPAAFRFLPDGLVAIAVGPTYVSEISLYDPRSGHRARNLGGGFSPVQVMAVTPDGGRLLLGDDEGGVTVVDLATGAEVGRLRPHDVAIKGLAVTSDGRIAVTTGEDLTVRFSDIATGQTVATLALFGGTDFLLATTDAYLATRGTFRGVAFRLGARVFPIEQFDAEMNRPERVLAALGYAAPEVLRAYDDVARRRARRLGAAGARVDPDAAAAVSLAGAEVPPVTARRELALRVRVSPRGEPVSALHVFVNDVPVLGAAGLPLSPPVEAPFERELRITLHRGRNKVQVLAETATGRQSLRLTREISFTGEAPPPALHVVVVGVSRYRDPRLDLEYAAKDAADLAELFARGAAAGTRVSVTRVLDAEATRERILGLRDALARTEVDDRVVLFLAGHGVLDDALAYWFAPSDFDLSAPSRTGVSFEEIEALLDGIPARRKLLLLDTCHAGELESDDLAAAPAAPGAEVRTRAFRPLAPGQEGARSARPAALPPEVFLDLRRGSGATVIAAAGGAEYAFESSTWSNGVFTHSVLAALRDLQADANEDRRIQLSELREFVSERVATLTRGRQRPVARRENPELDELLDLSAADRRPKETSGTRLFEICDKGADGERLRLACGRLVATFGRRPLAAAGLDAALARELEGIEPARITVRRVPVAVGKARLDGRAFEIADEKQPWRRVLGTAANVPGRGLAFCAALDGDAPTLGRCAAMIEHYAGKDLPEWIELGLPPAAR